MAARGVVLLALLLGACAPAKYVADYGTGGRLLGLMPLVRVFTARQLIDSLKKAGFRIDHQWRPDNAMSLFVVASKAA